MWLTSRDGRLDQFTVFRHHGSGYVPIGELTFEGAGRVRQSRFRYAGSYFAREEGRPIDPIGLPLRRRSVSSLPHEVPLAFYDAGPDGWGKGILEMAYPSLQLGMGEFLALGGKSRTGDLAFGPSPSGPATWVPGAPLVVLPSEEDDLEELVRAVDAVENGAASQHHLHLLARGSADLGGARPKARLKHDGRDWIAKMPARDDVFDEPRVEAVCLDIAEAAGVQVPDRRLVALGNRSVLLVRRFDRSDDGRPYSYLSAATLLKQSPREYATRMTYLDIAEVARSLGAQDAHREMFRRLLINAYLHNTDDHLRNHALIDRGEGWCLSPAFDIVPIKTLRHVCAPAPGVSPEWNPSLSFSTYASFGLKRSEADALHDEVRQAVSQIDDFLDRREVSAKDRETLAPLLSGIERRAFDNPYQPPAGPFAGL